jgi:mannose PTS system EIIA component
MAMPNTANKPKVGVVVVTHEGAADALVTAARALLGNLQGVAAVPCAMADDFPTLVDKISRGCQLVDEGAGVVMLVDLHGSSPFHACMSLLDGTRAAEVLCGVNLPMLIKVATIDRTRQPPNQIAEALCDIGRRSIRLGSELTGRVSLNERSP